MQGQGLALFTAALGLTAPWQVTSVAFDVEARRLDLSVDFARGAKFACPECDAQGLAVHDSEQKTWRHMDFFQHQAYLTARVPRVVCAEHKVRLVAVRWARPRSGFTLLFEALIMAMVKEMPGNAVAAPIGEGDKRIWRVLHHYVDQAVEAQDLSDVKRVGIDETSSRRGHDDVTVVADLDRRCGVFCVEGKDHQTVQAFSLFLQTHGGDRAQVSEVCQDMSQAFEKGVVESFPSAQITCDRYHVKAQLSQAVDLVRRQESKHHRDLLKNTRYMWLKRPENLTERQRDLLDELLAQPLDTVRAYTLSQQFDSFYELDDPDTAQEYLRRWISEVDRSGLEPLAKFARLIEDRWAGVIAWHHSKITNGLMEGLNSLIQAANAAPAGIAATGTSIAMIYLIVAKLNAGPLIA